jgi:hypothetical protein
MRQRRLSLSPVAKLSCLFLSFYAQFEPSPQKIALQPGSATRDRDRTSRSGYCSAVQRRDGTPKTEEKIVHF